MAITNMRVSYVGSTITVKIPTAQAPSSGLPFSMSSSMTPAVEMALTDVTSGVVGLDKIYTIIVDPTQTYMVRAAGTMSSGGYVPTTMAMMQGESYDLQPAPYTNILFFKNLDSDAPEVETITKLSSPGSIINGATVDINGMPPDTATKTYFVAKFNEAVTGVDPQSFYVARPGNSSVPGVTVQPLALTNANVLSVSAGQNLPAASLYLVTVNDNTNTVSVSLKTAPPPISIVQELDEAPPPMLTYGGTSIGTQPIQTQNVSWLRVSLENTNANQFLLEAGGVPVGSGPVGSGMVPRLEYTFAGDEGMAGFTRTVQPNYAVSGIGGVNSNVIYLGFNSEEGLTEAPISVAFKTTNSMAIVDRAGNFLGSSSSDTTVRYLDAAGEPMFSSDWEGDTTTITNASLVGYANGANVVVNAATGAKTFRDGYDPSLPSYFTDGKPLGKDLNGNPLYDVDGDRIGLDTIDLSAITVGRMKINADDGEAFVYVGNDALVLDVSDYDRYILNDSVGNEFHGTEDSEYVVVGSGGNNYLVAGNLLEYTDISADNTVKNYQFDTEGIVRETDIVDYSQLDMGITVDLGDDASADVSVFYDGTQQDTIVGFEGVVGSGGDDLISGSNVGNFLVGDAGDDVLKGYTGAQDMLYDKEGYLDNVYHGPEGDGPFQAAQFLVDSSDILYGGTGDDELYGGAGRDMLIDLGKAEMLGSDKTGFLGDGTAGLRDSKNKDIAENDVFWVRGDGAEKATINNFHLSKDGTGLAGRSNSANDAILFAIDTSKLFSPGWASMLAWSNDALYDYVYSRLTFEQIKNNDNDDIELVVNYRHTNLSQAIKVGSTTIADVGSMLDGDKNMVNVVELKWLSKGDDPLYLFNPAIDMDLANFVPSDDFGSSSMNIAVALELLQAGTVRGSNDYGVMAAKQSDNILPERVYNPGDKDDRILGTTGADSYEYIVQQFTPTVVIPPGQQPPLTPPVITNQVGQDKIFDTGGDDVLIFESASIQDLVFSAVKVGRESKANSLKVVHKQTETLDDGDVKNEGEVVWQGHYKEGGRQAAEVLKLANGQEFEIAQAVYEYNAKGYAKGGPKITADNARDVIMVGQGAGDKFVFDFTPPTTSGISQTARIAGFGQNDKIDVSQFGDLADGGFTKNLAGQNSTVKLEFETGFVLNLSFQDSVSDADLNFALSSILT